MMTTKHPLILSMAALFGSLSIAAAETTCDAAMMRGSIAQISPTHATVDTAIVIDASPAQVWAALSDFEQMAEWSSGTLQTMTGDIRDGGVVEIVFLFGQDENGDPIENHVPHTLIYQDGAHFGWSDPFPQEIGGGRDNHIYKVQPCGDQSLFVQTDEITGNPYAANFATQLMPLYQVFNADLKAVVEAQ